MCCFRQYSVFSADPVELGEGAERRNILGEHMPPNLQDLQDQKIIQLAEINMLCHFLKTMITPAPPAQEISEALFQQIQA